MVYLLYILLAVTLFQDVKHRGVHWSVFLLLLASAVIYKNGLEWQNIGFNLMFIAVLLSALTLYLSLKQGRIVNITHGYFSWGDILFLIVVAPLFEWRTYMIFFILGTIGVLITHLIINAFRPQKTVPYAGYMAPIVAFFVAVQPDISSFFMLQW